MGASTFACLTVILETKKGILVKLNLSVKQPPFVHAVSKKLLKKKILRKKIGKLSFKYRRKKEYCSYTSKNKDSSQYH